MIHIYESLRVEADPMPEERQELLAKVATLYFEENLSQAEISAQTGYSRSMVSRLLTEARNQGIVEIRIRHPSGRRTDLERELQNRLQLKVVRVLAYTGLDEPQMLRRLGSITATLSEELVHDGMTIGVTWGPAIYETVNALQPGKGSGIHVVQMMGSVGSLDPQFNGQELARRLARALIGYYTPLPAPLVVDSESTRESLIKDPQIQQAIERFKNIELALVQVDTLDPERSILARAGYLTSTQLEELEQCGAVGELCGLDFDLYGNVVDAPLSQRIIGIDATTLAKIPLKIGIAAGQSMTLPIIGAGRAKLIDVLVTDEMAATSALQILRKMGASDWNGKTDESQTSK